MTRIDRLGAGFANPAAEHRSLPFWAWNDVLEEDELRRQIDGMHEQGMGGFFMHSRDGLETPYMGEQWMAAVRASVERAGQLGMKAWMYDEDRWPSGTAGGRIPGQGDEYRSKGLTLETTRSGIADDPRIVAAFAAVIDGLSIRGCRRLAAEPGSRPVLADDETLLIFRQEVSGPSEWFNGETPPDNLNPDTVRAFIADTYEAYKAAVGEQFGRTIAGVFTDEPGVHDRNSAYPAGRGWIPWTTSFPAYFAERRGHDMLDIVPYIYYDGEHSAKARHDYWRTVAERFCESYTRQLGQWCGDNDLAFTGHFLWENALGVATRTGGAIMPHYRYQHMPGIDLLCEQTDEHMTVKQCTSVANQYGRKFVLSETYGCAGWAFTFEGQKWVGDWQYALGVNVRSQHLSMYSIRGCRKRDYPPFFSYQTSWWKYARIVEDYFARIGAVTVEGTPVRDVLVLHPASTAWSMLGTNPHGSAKRGEDRNIPEIDRYGYAFNDFLRLLLGEHYDFDLGDETIMAEAGAVRGGKLAVREAEYDVVIVPAIATMLRSTHDLLLRFLEQGGTAIALPPMAMMIEGAASADAEALYAHPGVLRASGPEEAIALLARRLPRPVRIRDRSGKEASELLCLFKRVEDGHTLFVVNNDRERAYDVEIDLAAVGRVEEWHPLTGGRSDAQAWLADGRMRVRARFGPADSKLYTVRSLPAAELALVPALPVERPEPAAELLRAFGPSFRFTRTMPNVLTLDKCEYRIGDGAWSERTDMWIAQQKIREALDMRQIYYNGMTQRYKWVNDRHPNDGAPVAVRLGFRVDVVPRTDVRLVIEGARLYDIVLNGQPVSGGADGWFVDRSLDTVRLDGIRAGDNTLELRCAYTQAMEMEDCYLIGDFGVGPDRAIIGEPGELVVGDWGLQGYRHYNGSLVYHAEFEYRAEAGARAVLRVGPFSAVMIEVRANGRTAGHIPWKAADGIDLTPYLTDGSNALEIEVMGSPRNMFGPFHQAEGDTLSTDWSSFRTTGSAYTPDYVLHPYGIFGQVKLMRVRG